MHRLTKTEIFLLVALVVDFVLLVVTAWRGVSED